MIDTVVFSQCVISRGPLSEDPPIPIGMSGRVVDVDEELSPVMVVVDFGSGAVLCELFEVGLTPQKV